MIKQTTYYAADVYYCPKRNLIYIRDEHAPTSDAQIGTLEDLESDIEHGLRGDVVDVAAAPMVFDYLNPPENKIQIVC